VAEERAAVKRYREYVEKLLRDEVPRPTCARARGVPDGPIAVESGNA
jgi:hypothetical protein